MKYSKFKQTVIDNMPDNKNPGLWRGKGEPQKHILGNPSSPKEKAELINKYSIIEGVTPIDYKTIHLHTCAHHLNSSQIMCYNFFRPMIEDYDGEKYKPKECLVNLLSKVINQELVPEGSICNFEHINDSNEKTNFDFYFESGDIRIYCEIKYTEEFFAKTSSAKEPQKRYESVYKQMIHSARDIFINGTINEKDFNEKYYQLSRNAIRATSANKHVLFIYPQKNEGLKQQFEQFSKACLTEEGKKRVRLITWEELVHEANKLGCDVSNFDKRYLAFLRESTSEKAF